ncbi:unnamed protein product [Rhizophagus irregularis]|nr:unnamed protein product [Rhizophagus irregularis]
MELYKKLIKEKPSIKKDQTGETAIFTTTKRGSTMYGSGDRWCRDSSDLNSGRPMYFLLDKHRSSSEKTRETNNQSIRTSKTTISLDNAIGEKSYNFLEERPSEGKEDCILSVIDRSPKNQTKDAESLTRIHLKNQCMFPWDENGNLLMKANHWDYGNCAETNPCNTTNNGTMLQLSGDGGLQCEKDLPELLFSLKDKYSFRDETNKNILYDDEIKRFAKLYCITNFCPVLSCHDSIFWLKDPDGIIYIWSRIDGMMIHGGCDMKEALLNFLFHEENLYYIEDYTLELIPVKKAKEEAKKWCEENKNTTTKFVITDELLKPLEEKKERWETKEAKKKKK